MLKTPADKNAFTHLMRDVIRGLPMVDGNDRLWKAYRETLAKAIELRSQIIRKQEAKS